jgi:hypothetical protein
MFFQVPVKLFTYLLFMAAFVQVLQTIGEVNTGSKPFKEAKAAIQQSIGTLKSDSNSNAEIWVKLARCALLCGFPSQAVIAARTALADSTSSPQALLLSATHPSERTVFRPFYLLAMH